MRILSPKHPSRYALARVLTATETLARMACCLNAWEEETGGCLSLSWIQAEPMGVRCVRRSPGSDHGPGARAKKTACGVCGRKHRTFYDRKRRPVRDLFCGDTLAYHRKKDLVPDVSCDRKMSGACGVCGRKHRTFYDRKRRPVRDLSCGDTREYLRKKDLVPDVSCDRKMSGAFDRKRRKQFFLLSLQDHDPNLGISEHTAHPSARPESRKAIGILQSLLPKHSSIMPFSRGSQLRSGPLQGRIGRGVSGSKSAFFTHTIPRRPRIYKIAQEYLVSLVVKHR